MMETKNFWGNMGLDFFYFGMKEALSCLFAGSFLFLLFLSQKLPLGDFPRYDFLFLAALGLQVLLVVSKLETPEEMWIIFIFHLVGLALEVFKTHPSVNSWVYPEPGFFKLGTVPLYSGFMYAAVGSYIMASWRHLKLRFDPMPAPWMGITVCGMIYLNFFTNHWFWDIRWVLLGIVLLVYGRTWVYFIPRSQTYRMPLVLAFVLIGFFIWLAENIATFFGAWQYPDQTSRWSLVSLGKISSWGLLVIISFVIVALWKQRRRVPRGEGFLRREQK